MDLWEEEELTYRQGAECLSHYETVKPDIVISHTCPYQVLGMMVPFMSRSCSTEKLLGMMLEIHKPKMWIFGHFHKSSRFNFQTMEFIVLNELETIEI